MTELVTQTTSATATFLFTDIDGSTQLLKAHRGEYAAILAEHHRLLRETFATYRGTEVDSQGDAFFVAFKRVKDAVLAAAEAQRAIAGHTWPGGASVRVRMGIHTGEADVAMDRYLGLSVHRAARISAVGHGGQVLVSQTTAGLLEDDVDELLGIALRDLGEHRLKDIARPVRVHQLDIDGLPRTFPPLTAERPPVRSGRRRAALIAAGLLLAGVAASVLTLTRGSGTPPVVVPNSLVRIDPDNLQPADVVPVGSAPDLVVAAGGFLWVTHHVLRDVANGGLRNAGDRTLTRVDPERGDAVTVGGGLAPCGLTPDPSGDVWVANCFASGAPANVTRVDSTSLRFDPTWPAPGANGFYRGLTYGGGSLWVSNGEVGSERPSVTQLDPGTGKRRSIRIPSGGSAVAWAEGYGDLWIGNFEAGTLTKIDTATGAVDTIDVPIAPAPIVVDGDAVWVGDWSGPRVERLSAVGPAKPRIVRLPVRRKRAEPGVWSVAAGEGYVWAATPRDAALWRIDPKTNAVKRIPLRYGPTGVTTGEGSVWVVVGNA